MANEFPYGLVGIHDIFFLEDDVACFVKFRNDVILEGLCDVAFQLKVVQLSVIE